MLDKKNKGLHIKSNRECRLKLEKLREASSADVLGFIVRSGIDASMRQLLLSQLTWNLSLLWFYIRVRYFGARFNKLTHRRSAYK